MIYDGRMRERLAPYVDHLRSKRNLAIVLVGLLGWGARELIVDAWAGWTRDKIAEHSGVISVIAVSLLNGLISLNPLLIPALALALVVIWSYFDSRSEPKPSALFGKNITPHGSLSMMRISGPNSANARLVQFTTEGREQHEVELGARPLRLSIEIPSTTMPPIVVRESDLPARLPMDRSWVKRRSLIIRRFTDRGFVVDEDPLAGVEVRVYVLDAEAPLASIPTPRAALSFKYAVGEPYRLSSGNRLGVYNHGPDTAHDVKGQLVSIQPNYLVPEGILPCLLQWKDDGLRMHVIPKHERILELFSWRIDGQKGVIVITFAAGTPWEFEPAVGLSYRIRVEAFSEEGACAGDYDLMVHGPNMLFVTFTPVG